LSPDLYIESESLTKEKGLEELLALIQCLADRSGLFYLGGWQTGDFI